MNACQILAAAALLAAAAAPGKAQQPDRRPREGNLRIGDAAPAFTVEDVEGKKSLKIAERRGRPLALVFGSCT
jgi:hypothetical protein